MGKTAVCVLTTLNQIQLKEEVQVLVLCHTRELAYQIGKEFELFSKYLPGIKCSVLFGGVPETQNEKELAENKPQIIVGTPGRIKDLLDRKSLKLDETAYAVLDEADQMLDMGFQEEIQAIFDAMEDRPKQVLLFSATMPSWVHGIADKYMNKDRKIIDLVGDSKLKAVTSVRHIAIPSQWTALGSMLNDIIAMFAGREGKVLVFCGTKVEVNHLL
jgi:superfamily II DNA/RNA helicase